MKPVPEVNILCQVVMKCVLIALSNGCLDTRICPERLDGLKIVYRHRLFRTDFFLHEDLDHVFLKCEE